MKDMRAFRNDRPKHGSYLNCPLIQSNDSNGEPWFVTAGDSNIKIH